MPRFGDPYRDADDPTLLWVLARAEGPGGAVGDGWQAVRPGDEGYDQLAAQVLALEAEEANRVGGPTPS